MFKDKKSGRKLLQDVMGRDSRIPINIMGDVMSNGQKPIVRHVLTGMDAHECMNTWERYNELLSCVEMLENVNSELDEPLSSNPDNLVENFALLKQRTADPQAQVSQDILNIYLPIVLFTHLARAKNVELCELGPDLFASIEKLSVAALAANIPFDIKECLFTGIEYSAFYRRAAKHLHPQHNLRLFKEDDYWTKQRKFVAHLSQFKASYTYRSTETLVARINKCDTFQLLDVFNNAPSEYDTWDLGLPMTFLDLPYLVENLSNKGWSLFLSDCHPDFHAPKSKKCLVAKIFGIRDTISEGLDYFSELRKFRDFGNNLLENVLTIEKANLILKDINSKWRMKAWRLIAKYKEIYPAWGKVPMISGRELKQRTSSKKLDLKLGFEHGQINDAVRKFMSRVKAES